LNSAIRRSVSTSNSRSGVLPAASDGRTSVSPGFEDVRQRERDRRGVDQIAELAQGAAGRKRRAQQLVRHAVRGGDLGGLLGPAAGERNLKLGHGVRSGALPRNTPTAARCLDRPSAALMASAAWATNGHASR
jgi:hypothetical protein